MTAVLQRKTFQTSRSLDFCSASQLTIETGHAPEHWPLVILKELLDNALDEAEEAGVAPEITVCVRAGMSDRSDAIVITDNGRGIPAEVVDDILDYTVRVSSREAYVSPTRGAQGNALKTIVAMPFALDGKSGTTLITGRGVGLRKARGSKCHGRIQPAQSWQRQNCVFYKSPTITRG